MATLELHLADEEATDRLGALLARALSESHDAIETHGFALTLTGDLGAGKTALVRACLRALGVQGPVKSPTFSLLEPYVVSSLNFYHFDFYRFADPEEFSAAGFRELFGPGNVCAVEWPERARGALPTPDIEVTLSVENGGRRCLLDARTPLGEACLQRIRAGWLEPAGDSAGA